MNSKRKVMIIFGTRPEAIKMAPLVLELQKYPEVIEPIVTVTAQHRDMLDQVLNIFKITPDYDLNMMKASQTLMEITTKGLEGLAQVLIKEKPDMVLVHGDTTTSFIASLAAFYHQIPVGHVEAGLRTGDKYAPYPEEMNRQLTGVLADLHFTPTAAASQNLHAEGKNLNIHLTGNTVIDALGFTVEKDYQHPILEKVGHQRFILLTAHRRENLGQPLEQIFSAVKQLTAQHDDLHLIYPVHPNPKIQQLAHELLGNHDRIHLIKPLDVIDFHNMIARAYLILTDSGGIQEEAPTFGVPVLVLRESTERPEGIKAGVSKLVGTSTKRIVTAVNQLLSDRIAYELMAKAANPYGDGKASVRIVQILLQYLGNNI